MAKINVSGLSVKDIAKLDKQTLDSLDQNQLSKVTSRLVSAMNKRIRYLEKSEIGKLSPTYQAYERRKEQHKTGFRDGFYSVRNKTRSELNEMFRQLSRSLSHTTTLSTGEDVEVTTVRGWKKHRQDVLDLIGTDFVNPETSEHDFETEKKFWSLYRKYLKDDLEYKNSKYRKDVSDKVLTYVINEIGTDFTDTQENFNRIKDRVNQLYEEQMGEENEEEKEKGVSQFFTDGGNV